MASQREEEFSDRMKKLFAAELKRVQQYEVEVTLDPDTAYPYLILSDDGKQVKQGDVKRDVPDNPERFSYSGSVFAKQSVFSGRFYYEVEVKGKTMWSLGVAKESVNRKERLRPIPYYGCWLMWLKNYDGYELFAGPGHRVSLKHRPEKVGVFVDYEEGVVSFYDVDAAALMYSILGCCFTERLFPLFNPCDNNGGTNSIPLIITPVKH